MPARKHPFYSKAEWKKILRRDPCAYCGAPGRDVDHILPRARYGYFDSDVEENWTSSCRACNASKADRPLLLFLLGEAA